MPRLSNALNSSLSGLALAGRMTATISNNVANSLTEGYAPREIVPTARLVGNQGNGVAIGAVQHFVDPALLAERRSAEADLALTSTRADFYGDIERVIGLPDDPTSLSNQVDGLNSALIEASTRPESEARLTSILTSAQDIASKLNSASDRIRDIRTEADREIATAVVFINETLQQIADLNVPQSVGGSGSEASLNRADQRRVLIDQLSEWVPVRELTRDNGTVALFTPGGAVLLDGLAVEFGFTTSNVVTAQMSLSGNTLSGLTINGQPVSPSAESGKIAGGRLAALFDVRDVQAPSVQTKLDAVARDLIERFEDPALDSTLAVGDPGLFTDAGAGLVVADEVGLAGRISVNSLVDPSEGGALWRLRDGLGAAAPGPVGNATLINAYSAALSANRVPNSGGFTASTDASGLASDVTTSLAAIQSQFAEKQAFAASRVQTLVAEELENGVDTDQEMQRLLIVEQAYAANARVISTIEELLDTLLRI